MKTTSADKLRKQAVKFVQETGYTVSQNYDHFREFRTIIHTIRTLTGLRLDIILNDIRRDYIQAL